MKNVLTILFISIATLSFNITAQTPKRRICGPTVNERLTKYFELAETIPDQIINNNDRPGEWTSKSQLIKIGDHTIEWIDKVEKLDAESTVKIDGQLLTLKDRQSVNDADEDRKIHLLIVGEWRQIKLYKLFRQEIIGLTLGPESCTGLMCGVAVQLFYDVNTKKVTTFGTFRADEEVRLFRLTNEVNFYYLSKRFDGDPHGEDKASITYEAYRLNPTGEFVIEKNKVGKPFFLKHTYYPDYL